MAHRSLVERLRQRRPNPLPTSPSGFAATPANSRLRLLAGLVHRRERRAGEARRRRRRPRRSRCRPHPMVPACARDHDDRVRGVAVDHEHLRAVERVARRPMPLGLHRDARRVPLAVRLGERERGDRLARRDAGEQLALLRVGAGVHDRVGREAHRREVRRAQQHAAHLLEHDAELDEREALAAVLLGDVQALEPELLGHLRPDRGVVALGGLHEPAHLASSGDFASMNLRTASRSWSCSSEKAKFIRFLPCGLECRSGPRTRLIRRATYRAVRASSQAGAPGGAARTAGTLAPWPAVRTSRTPASASTS